MDKIKWCLDKKAIKISIPNKNLSQSFLERAEKDLQNISNVDSHWKTIHAYYICYNAFTAVLLSYGLKSEIHSCTLEVLKLIDELKKYDSQIMTLKEKRINTQYYLKYEEINQEFIKEFVSACKLHIKKDINEQKIQKLQEKINPKS